jgi:hypothetical protein
MMPSHKAESEGRNHWNGPWRILVFALASTSIASLLVEFYQIVSMRWFAITVFLPASLALIGIAIIDLRRGSRQTGRAIVVGCVAGLVASLAYDCFRIPFVYSDAWGINSVVPTLKLFKVFPRFGAMILGERIEQPGYSVSAHLIGWSYHFSNGATFGIMYLAMVGDTRRRSWGWAVVMAVGLELGMLLTPYPSVFGIKLGPAFITVTLTAHLIFGVTLGVCSRWFAHSWRPTD